MKRYPGWIAIVLMLLPVVAAAQKRAMTFVDVMKFKAIKSPGISAKGGWLAYEATPDRGDGEAVFQQIDGKKRYVLARGAKPAIAYTEEWGAALWLAPFLERKKKKKDKPKPGALLIRLSTGQIDTFRNVQRFRFSNDGRWFAVHFAAEKAKKTNGGKDKKSGRRISGTQLLLRDLAGGLDYAMTGVLAFAFDSTSSYLAWAVADTAAKRHGVFVRRLRETGAPVDTVLTRAFHRYTNLRWSTRAPRLAFVEAEEKDDGKTGPATLWFWDAADRQLHKAADSESIPDGWMIPSKNYVSWSMDGRRLFFGLRPEMPKTGSEEKEKSEDDLYDLDNILEKREVDVWHWNDPYINPHQKKIWKAMQDTTYTAVFHLADRRVVQLGDTVLTRIFRSENADYALGITDVPYRKYMTWIGRLYDAYVVDLKTGERRRISERLRGRPVYLSPQGRFAVYYQNQHWHLVNTRTGETRNLTQNLRVVFFNEDHDYPYPPPGYGIAGWVENDAAVLIYDKYDLWQFPTDGGEPVCLTDGYGRRSQWIFRVHSFDRKKPAFKADEELLLLGYHDRQKHNGLFVCKVGRKGVKKLLEEPKRFRLIAKAKDADRILYTRESYTEFPDLWVADTRFRKRKKLTDVNPQMKQFAWGKAELVEWRSLDGRPLQGVLIKPGNYQRGKRYPVIVYFYRFFSQRLHQFNQPVVNHRPCFPLYASNGYAIFLPDIRFEVGRPGFAATKSLVPGVQKLIDMGIADPNRIGLHGHSWSGYQTAFIITQTNIFACAIAGAPVSNMTSAYSGIRWGSGLARQFQYEQTQSRIGGSLWEYPERYIANSPVFFADRINTPLLIMFGDEDGAVPWYQGIELYLAMRRLGKDCVFLQYRGEPHHLRKYPNKLDYAIKMKQYFDHYLKGMPAPDWIKKGVPYNGK